MGKLVCGIPIIARGDSWLKVFAIFISLIGLGFGIFAYFNSVKPVFDKEKEFIGLRAENITLVADRTSLSNQVENAKSMLDKLNKQNNLMTDKIYSANTRLDSTTTLVDSLSRLAENLRSRLRERDRRMDALLQNDQNAGFIAIEALLSKYSAILIEKYSDSYSAAPPDRFDFKNELNQLMVQEDNWLKSIYIDEAHGFLRDYIAEHYSPRMTGEEIRSAIIGIKYDFRLQQLRLRYD